MNNESKATIAIRTLAICYVGMVGIFIFKLIEALIGG